MNELKHLGLTTPRPTITTAAGKSYTWLYMPHSQMVVFYEAGKDIGYFDLKTGQASKLTGTPTHPDHAEVVQIWRDTQGAPYENDCI